MTDGCVSLMEFSNTKAITERFKTEMVASFTIDGSNNDNWCYWEASIQS